ncbi:MAG: sigma 54-interacting transcriptional regulator [Deltaproteobacteria bacterium]|jgi:PAS domain S-box-containing protein|nr:sigma 54-interacting transcriptional regulator [Deltaproteobacteria bacterium]
MTRKKHVVLFLGESGNNLQMMAECFALEINNRDTLCVSACMTPPELDPVACKIMQDSGMTLSKIALRSLIDIELFMFDLIITLGDFDHDCRPSLQGMPPHIHWDIPDPQPSENKDIRYKQLISARDKIKDKVFTLFDSDLLHALFIARRNLELVLDNLMDGVMAHTTNRRIFFFNKAAEKITGYNRAEILGKDCHDVFPGRFCGGFCDFCNGIPEETKKIKFKKVDFTNKNGNPLNLAMSIISLENEFHQEIGALISFKDETELDQLKSRLKHHHTLGDLVGRDPKTLELFNQIKEVSSSQVSVLIEGESGTGKELVANAIHGIGAREGKPFVAINCGALPEGILESELFGHVKGAFSGAARDRKGRFELADGGTIFLDEVGELSAAMQVKLLRVLQEKSFERVGGEKTIHVDIRIISATNQNLRKMMEEKKFRKDLFYRLCVVPIRLFPLKERRLDIPMLIEHFLEVIALEIKRPALTISNETMDILSAYDWPGNVRELHNMIEYAYVKCHSGTIETEHLPPEIMNYSFIRKQKPGPGLKMSKEKFFSALSMAEGNKKKAAEILGVSRATIYRYFDHYGGH